MNPILGYIMFMAFWGGIVTMLMNYQEPTNDQPEEGDDPQENERAIARRRSGRGWGTGGGI